MIVNNAHNYCLCSNWGSNHPHPCSPVPRYHFVVQDGSTPRSHREEVEFGGFEEARDEAIRRYGPSSGHRHQQLRSSHTRTVDVTDASDSVMFSLYVFAAESALLWPYHLSQYT